MEFHLNSPTYNSISRERISEYFHKRDFYNLNRTFKSEYSISISRSQQIEDENGIFVILSSILICIHHLIKGEACVLRLSDSPPNIVFRKNSSSTLLAQLDSYGSIIGEEVCKCSDIMTMLRNKSALCSGLFRENIEGDIDSFLDIINEMNPDYAGLLDLIAETSFIAADSS